MRHRYRLSEYRDLQTRLLNYLILGENESLIMLSEFQYELKPQDFKLLSEMLNNYKKLHLVDRMEDVALRMNEVVPNHPPYQILLADCYMLSGKSDKGLDVLNELLADNPEHVEALLKIGEVYLHKNDLAVAEEVFNRAIFLMPEEERHWTKLLDHIAYMRNIKDAQEVMESVEGTYRIDIVEFTSEIKIVQNQLFLKAINQGGLFMYPVSDSVFVCAFKNGGIFDFVTVTFIRNSLDKVIQYRGEQLSNSAYEAPLYWKEENLILDSKDLLSNGKTREALSAFRKAYEQNPEHFYLANYIQHLEFILSPEYESLKSVFSSYVGQYDDLKFQVEDGWLYYTDYNGLIFQLLPMTENKFMVPSVYNLQIQMIKEGGVVTGLKRIIRNGDDEFFAWTS